MAMAELQDDGRYLIVATTSEEWWRFRSLTYRGPVSREYAALILASAQRTNESLLRAECFRLRASRLRAGDPLAAELIDGPGRPPAGPVPMRGRHAP